MELPKQPKRRRVSKIPTPNLPGVTREELSEQEREVKLLETLREIVEAKQKTVAPPPPPEDPNQLTARERERFRAALYESYRRKNEALKLFQPLPDQEAFFKSQSPERIILGSNRSGKTLSACIEIARAVTSSDPHGKYRKTDGRIIVVGPSLKHLGAVFFEKLFKSNAFSIIRDLKTNQWRPFRPNSMDDQMRMHDARPAPPLIPRRFYTKKDVSWKLASDQQPLAVRISRTGWAIHFFSFNTPPPQGVDVDMCVFDEESATPVWYAEMSARLLDRRGKMIWSFTPQNATTTAFDLWKRYEEIHEAREPGDTSIPPIEAFHLDLRTNPYISEEAKAQFAAKFANQPDQLSVRVHGQWSIFGSRVYPDFVPRGVHGHDVFPIPDDWTRYVAIDPGHQVCGILFAAIPNPRSDHAGQIFIYDELYLKRCNAKIFAEEFTRKVGQTPIQYGLIDHRMGRETEIGSGVTIERQYTLALREKRFKFVSGEDHFHWGSDDKKAGIEAVRNALHIVAGRTTLQVFREKVPNLLKEMERYATRKLPDGTITDEPIDRNNHLCLIAGTMITTERGDIPIEEVQPGDRALTRQGWKDITDWALTDPAAHVLTVELEDGTTLTGTPNHPVWLRNMGYVTIAELRSGDTLLGVPSCPRTTPPRSRSFTRESRSTASQTAEAAPAAATMLPIPSFNLKELNASTVKSGKTTMAPFQKDTTSITRTEITITTISPTSNVCLDPTTWSTTDRTCLRNDDNSCATISIRDDHSRPTGMHQRKDSSGTPKTRRRCGPTRSPSNTPANGAARNTNPPALTGTNSVLENAAPTPGKNLALTMKREPANDAALNSSSIDTPKRNTAPPAAKSNQPSSTPAHIAESPLQPREDGLNATAHPRVARVVDHRESAAVYNITVDGAHEYFANGVLVSNCDCLRYLVAARLKWIRPPETKREKPFIIKVLEEKRAAAKRKRQAESPFGASYNVG